MTRFLISLRDIVLAALFIGFGGLMLLCLNARFWFGFATGMLVAWGIR